MITTDQFRGVLNNDIKKLSKSYVENSNYWAGGMEHVAISRKYKNESLRKLIDNWNIKGKWKTFINVDQKLVNTSAELTYNVRKALGNKHDFLIVKDNQPVDLYNAEDFMFQNPIQLPNRLQPRKILEIGAGYGRQINLWRKTKNLVFCSLEAVEAQYLAQNEYYSYVDELKLNEYFDDTQNFKIQDLPGIYHLPTWRMDLLPENFFDYVIAVQVLQELGDELIEKLLDIFCKCIKPGGAIYIRDHDLEWVPGHKLNLHEILPDLGFEIEFCPIMKNKHDIFGLPRIYRKPEIKNHIYRNLDSAINKKDFELANLNYRKKMGLPIRSKNIYQVSIKPLWRKLLDKFRKFFTV